MYTWKAALPEPPLAIEAAAMMPDVLFCAGWFARALNSGSAQDGYLISLHATARRGNFVHRKLTRSRLDLVAKNVITCRRSFHLQSDTHHQTTSSTSDILPSTSSRDICHFLKHSVIQL